MRILIAFLILFSSSAFAQDTIRVYFDFGSSKIKSDNDSGLSNLAAGYNLSALDSVQFIGYADSVGNVNSNMNLSMKRARSTYKYCKKSFGKKIYISLLAKGELTKKDPSLNRRVDIILYYAKDASDENAAEEIIENVDPKCFYVDLKLLQYCHVRTIINKKKETVYIEALNLDQIKNAKLYYVKKDVKGKATVQRVKWKEEMTGQLWWQKKRLVTTVPKKGFEQFQFFTLKEAPCEGCSEKIFSSDTIVFKVSEPFSDIFLMENMQMKVRFFGGHKVKLRAPKEYVDLSDRYFYHTVNSYDYIQWETKKSKRKQNYYFAEMPIVHNRIPEIKRSRLITHCAPIGQRSSYRDPMPFCSGILGMPFIEFQLNVEPGVFYHNDTVTGYLAAGASYTTENSYTSFLAGINTHTGFYGSLKYQYHFFSFPFQALSPSNRWSTPSGDFTINTYGRVYAGAEFRTSYNKRYNSFLEGNLHLGVVCVNTRRGHFFPRIYLHGGIAKDFSNRINTGFYGFVQVGLTINLNSVFINY